MYFLTEEERRYVLRKPVPEAREQGVAGELRGWNWHQPPLSPIYESPLGIYEIAGKYCSTGRDVYLRRVLGLKRPPNQPMVEGATLHRTLAELILASKRIIYNLGVGCLDQLSAVRPDRDPLASAQGLTAAATSGLRAKVDSLMSFERHRIVARVQDVLARQPYVGADSLVAQALPVTVEQRLDGTFLGLSAHLSADAFNFAEPTVLDIKFGSRETFHRLTTTGYALVMESVYEFPVNLGCIVYVSFREGRVILERDFHRVDDELRQWFIDERDERMRMVEEQIDPGVGQVCGELCPYHGDCRG
ncbi:MAG: type I-A CRISPR-associated protein Cas4/Csa1 [Chloroflexi bacterium]|nr:type I-A CRISPR-associated protein Cas4/Csa1 [Chloroflexota bacterium]